MSIDIFGRLFRQTRNLNRSPPGIGFKVTNAGNVETAQPQVFAFCENTGAKTMKIG